METNEKILFSNSFGSVTDKRIILNYKSGTEDLPVGQITSVSYQHRRNYVFAIGGFLIFLGGLIAMLANISNIGGAEVLIVVFQEEHHELFTRNGDDIIYTALISFTQATLGLKRKCLSTD